MGTMMYDVSFFDSFVFDEFTQSELSSFSCAARGA